MTEFFTTLSKFVCAMPIVLIVVFIVLVLCALVVTVLEPGEVHDDSKW